MGSALLVIDVQRGLFETSPSPGQAEAVIARINALAARARAAGVAVMLVQHQAEHTPLQRGAPGWSLDPRLQTHDGDRVVYKTTPDAFLHTDLQIQLAALGVDHLLVCGYASEFCVDTTVRRAAALGYSVTVVADAHTTHDKPHADAAQIRTHHNATLSGITSFGPRIRALAAETIEFAA